MAPKSVPLAELGQITQGITPSRYASKNGSFFQVINLSDLENLCITDVKSQAQLDVPEFKRYELLANDVVIAIRGSILKSAVVTDASRGSVSNQNTVFFRPKTTAINPLYLAILLRSKYFEQFAPVRESRSTTTLPSIKVSDVRRLEIPLPELHIQNQIAQLFLSIEQARNVALAALETRQKLSNVALFQALGVQT